MFNFIGFCHTLIILALAYFLAGFTLGFLASLGVVVVLFLACWCYRPLTVRKPSPRVQIEQFGGYLFRVEVA